NYKGTASQCQAARTLSPEPLDQINNAGDSAAHNGQHSHHDRGNHQFKLQITFLIGWRQRTLRKIRWRRVSGHANSKSKTAGLILNVRLWIGKARAEPE